MAARESSSHSHLRCMVYRGTKASWGLEAQGIARVFLSEVHHIHMSNIYFMIFMMVVSYFYITFSQFLGYVS